MPISTEDRELYDRNAASWWGEGDRFFRSLRSVNQFHEALLEEELEDGVEGLTVVDLGCGGGLFTVPLAERGARAIGVDLSLPSLKAGLGEAQRRGVAASFVRADLGRAPLPSGCADLVLLSDVLEHVEAPAQAIREAGRLLRDGGILFANTFDRSRASAFVIVTLAEGVGLVPKGTHDARLFIRPSELEAFGEQASLELTRLQHEAPAFLRTLFNWTVHLKRTQRGFGYTAFFRKSPS